jgi:N-acetylglucosaminyl-diphospho-decaprenol L-rhamnosyltransferase
MTDLAIIIVSYNDRADLARALDSLSAAPPTTPHQVVVVDNASSDGSIEMVRERFPRVLALEAGGNLGFSKANNLGIRSTASDLVLLLNSDTVVPPGAIDGLVRVLLECQDVAIVGPRLVDADGQPEISFGRMLDPFVELRRQVIEGLYRRGCGPVRRHVDRQLATPHDVDWVSGACLLVRRADADEAGLLDERFFLYTEDVDFCAAVRARGRRVRFEPSIEVRHLRGRSRAYDPSSAREAYRRSQLAFYAKHHPRWLPVLRWYLRVRGRLPRT